jgi:hypothetical protein
MDILERLNHDNPWLLVSPEECKREIGSLRREVAKSKRRVDALEELRPHWTQGYSDDSIAAQAATAALAQVWRILGAEDQTQCMEKLGSLFRQLAGLRTCLTEIVTITDRKHEAWDRVKVLLEEKQK